MMIYRHKRTGATISIASRLTGSDWEDVTPKAAAPDAGKEAEPKTEVSATEETTAAKAEASTSTKASTRKKKETAQ